MSIPQNEYLDALEGSDGKNPLKALCPNSAHCSDVIVGNTEGTVPFKVLFSRFKYCRVVAQAPSRPFNCIGDGKGWMRMLTRRQKTKEVERRSKYRGASFNESGHSLGLSRT